MLISCAPARCPDFIQPPLPLGSLPFFNSVLSSRFVSPSSTIPYPPALPPTISDMICNIDLVDRDNVISCSSAV
nr:hypothetical protein CFP56_64695 [Quercus suber]